MSATVAIPVGSSVRRFAKVSRTASEAARLEREAEILRALRHPGAVRLVTADTSARPYVLVTEHVGGTTLGEAPGGGELRLLADLAEVLADLHARGWVHGRVNPDHVLVDHEGRPVLCGWGYGGRDGAFAASLPPPGDAYVDPARMLAPRLDPTVDVFALGVLVREAADPRLEELAAWATAEDPSARPTAREMATVLRSPSGWSRLPRPAPPGGSGAGGSSDGPPAPTAAGTVPRRHRPSGAGRTAGTMPGRPGPRPSPRGGIRTVAGLAAVAVAAATAWTLLRGPPEPASQPRSDPAPARGPGAGAGPPEPAGGASAPRTLPSAPAPPGCPAATGPLQADVDGDGCPETLRYEGGVLAAGSLRWAVGRAGDLPAVGLWGCAPHPTLVLVRPSSGDVHLFRSWALPGEELVAERIGRVPGAQAVWPADTDGDGCSEVVVEPPAGPPVALPIAPRGPAITLRAARPGAAALPAQVTTGGDGRVTMRGLGADAEWVVAPGESFWSGAESIVVGARPGGQARPAVGEVAAYWVVLVEANRARLGDPANPDLIYAGQVFTVPPPA